MWFPNYTEMAVSSDAYNLLCSENSSTAFPVWYGEVLNYIPYTLNLSSLLALLKILGFLPSILGSTNWWEKVMDLLFTKGYAVDPKHPSFRGTRTTINYGLLRDSKCPIKRSSSGVIEDNGAATSLFPGGYETLGQTTAVYGDVVSSLTQNLTAMDAVTASSSFWNVGLVEGTELEYEATKGWLTHYTAVGSSGKDEKVYAMDGGLIDTTGITSHLRTKERSIVSFYNNNDDLRTLNSTIAFLFGSSTSTDTMNALEGAVLGQVFDESLYEGVIRNLTDPDVLRARLRNVQVKNNSYMGVQAYVLEELYLVSNQYTKQFLDTFNDSKVPAGIADGWPNNMPVGFDTFNSNMLCLFSQWKIRTFMQELKALFEGW